MPILLHLLGPLQIQLDPAPEAGFESDKVRALLIYLAAEPARPHRRASLAELLWPERPERAALLNLNQALANLRRVVGDREAAVPLLLVSRETIQWNTAAPATSDLARFTSLLEASARHSHEHLSTCAACQEQLAEAARLYNGPFLEQFALRDSAGFQEWALVVRERLHRQALELFENLSDAAEQRGDTGTAILATYRLIELDPWQESAHRRAMRLHWQMGNRAAALAQYERCRSILVSELGLEPEAETSALFAQIRDNAAPPSEPAAPAPAEPAAPTHGALPAASTPFLGRERELDQIAALLRDPDTRLISIIGLGGSGKTRLALQVARTFGGQFPQGVCFVPLAAVDDAAGVVPAIAARLGMSLRAAEDQLAQLGAFLRGQRMLLVLDNLEHLPVAPLVAQLLELAAEPVVLATSRERLNIQSEWATDIGGLGLPADLAPHTVEDSSAAKLFVQAARRAHTTFAPKEADFRTIGRICQRLGGHPLAIELAAAWVHTLSCSEIEAELAASQDLLASQAHDLPERQRTIRAVFDATWRLLPEDEQRVLRRLAVFRGGFDRGTAAQVAGASLPRLAALLNRSLVVRQQNGRYDMHEFVRQYAIEQLGAAGDASETANRHMACFAQLVEQADPHMKTDNEAAWMDRLESEHDNLRAALAFAAEHDPASAARMCEVLRWFWYIRGYIREGGYWMSHAVHAAERAGVALPPAQEAKLWQGAGIFADEAGAYDRAEPAYREALRIYGELGDTRGIQITTNSMGILAWSRGDHSAARGYYAESLRLARQLDHTWGIANSLNNLGTAQQALLEHEAALASYREALEYAERVGYEHVTTMVLDNIGDLSLAAGDTAEAGVVYGRALARQQAAADPRGAALSQHGLGLVALAEGRTAQAAELLHTSLVGSWQTASRRDLTLYADSHAALRLAQGRVTEAVRICAATTATRAKIGSPLSPFEQVSFERTINAARAALDPASFEQAWAAGSALALDDLLAELLGPAAA